MSLEDPTITGPALVLPGYADQELYLAWLGADLTRLKELYETLDDVRLKIISIESGEGEQLDRIGAIVGEPRWTTDDDQYRLTLRVRVLINRSNGTIDELVRIAALLADTAGEAGSYIRLSEVGVAGIIIEVVRTLGLPSGEVSKRLRQAKAAGVGMTVVFSASGLDAPATALRFGWTGGAIDGVTGALNGLTWTGTMDPGGYFAHARV